MYPIIDFEYIQIPTYVLCAGIGMIFGTIVMCRYLLAECKVRSDVPLMQYGLVGLLIGSKMFGFLSVLFTELQDGKPVVISEIFQNSGIVYYGGLLFFLAFAFIGSEIRKVDCAYFFSVMSFVIPLFHGFGRMGCFLAGCCYGCQSESVLAIPVRVEGHVAISKRLPIQLYESAFEFLLFFIIWYLFRKFCKFRPLLMYVYLCIYSIWRFFVEFFRGDSIRGVYGDFSFSQYISAIIVVWAMIMIYKSKGVIAEDE